MSTDMGEISQLGFMVIYLIYIAVIVTLMAIKIKNVPKPKYKTALWVLIGFCFLLIGDIGHVGARIIAFFSDDPESTQMIAIIGIGGMLEGLGILILFMIWAEVWRNEFQKKRNILYYILLGLGVVGLILFIFPQNEWTTESASYGWLVLRNMPWFIIGVVDSILIFIEAKKINNKTMKRIGIYILLSFFFYMPVIFAGHILPMLGMLMIPGTILYMIWEMTSLNYWFKTKE